MNRSHMVFTFGKKLIPVNLSLEVPAMHCATAVWLFKHSTHIKLCSQLQDSNSYVKTAHMHVGLIFLEEAS